ncbi:MAG: 50S ribosomal protein L14e [Candidatus Diapherotrites archaeon]|nr:50S ribosomal protein L14e [Candidatus Diapherotrites archaeon]
MAGIEVGMVCVKVAGKNAGQKVVVVDKDQDGFVIVEGIRVKRKRCNVTHLFVTPKKIEIKKGAPRAEIVAALA